MSISLDFNIKASGAPELGAVSNAVTQINEKLKLSSGELKIFDAALMSGVKSGMSLKDALNQLSQANNTVTPGINKLAKELLGADAGFKAADAGAIKFANTLGSRVVPEIAAASGAIRVLEGGMPIRAVENLLTKTLGLGSAFQAAFPVFGGIAMVEVMGQMVNKAGELFNAWDPIAAGEQRALEKLKELNKEFFSLSKQSRTFELETIERTRGKEARLRAEASDARNEGRSALDLTKSIPEQMAVKEQSAKRNLALANNPILKYVLPEVGDYFGKQGVEDARAADYLRNDLENQNLKATVDKEHDAALTAAADDEAKRKADEAARKAEEARRRLQSITDRIAGFTDKAELGSLGPIGAVEIQRRAAIRGLDREAAAEPGTAGKIGKLRSLTNQDFDTEQQGAIDKILKENASKLAQNLATDAKGETRVSDFLFSKNLTQTIQAQEKGVRANEQISDIGTAADRDVMLRGAQRSQQMAKLQFSGPGQEGLAINAGLDNQLKTAKEIFDLEAKRASVEEDSDKQRVLMAKARADYEKETANARLDAEMKIQELQDKQTKEARTMAGSFFDAALSGPAGLRNFAKSQALGIGKTVFENASTGVFASLKAPLTQDANSPIGKLLSGTPFGADPVKSLLAPAIKLDTAGDKLIQAAAALGSGGAGMAGGAFGDASGFGAPSIPGIGSISDLARIPGLTTLGSDTNGITGGVSSVAKATGLGSFLNKATTGLGGFLGLMGNPFGDKGGSPGINGAAGTDDGHISGMGIAAAGVDIAVGAMTAIQQFKRGGAKGALGGTSAILGTAASLDPEPISKTILGATAAITGMVTTLLGDPKVQRANAIASNLFKDQYLAPQAINASSSTGGGFSDTDRFGNVRASTLSPYSQSSQSYLDVPYRFNVPGGQTSQFGGGAAPVIINIHALDTQSFETAMKSNSVAVAESVAHGLTFAQTKLPTALRATLGMG